MSSEWKSIASCPADEIVHMVDHKVGNKPFLGYGSAGLFLTRKGSNWTTAERPPTHWMPILMPDPPADFPLSDESPGPREKPGGKLHWNNLSTCPVDEEVWLIDHVDTGPYVGKILKPSAHRASFTNVPLFCALEDRDDHPNPVMWAKKNNDPINIPEPPAGRTTQDYQSNLNARIRLNMMHAIHDRLNTINAVLKKRFSDTDTQLEKICEWKNKPWEKRELDERKQDGRPSVIPYDPAKGMPEQHRKHDELYYLEKIQGDIKCIAGALELQSERLARMEKWLSTLRAQSFTAGKDHLPR